jgi:DNA polymerase II small subunit
MQNLTPHGNLFKPVSARFGRMRKDVLRIFNEQGVLLDRDAAEALSGLQDPMRCAKMILNDTANRPLVLTRADIDYYEGCALKVEIPILSKGLARIENAVMAPELKDRIRILKDITGNSTCVGNIIDFAKLFNDRFSTLKRMLAKRRELAGLMPISKVKKVERDLRFVGIVNDSHTTKNGHTIIEMEDETDRIQVLVMKGSRKAGDAVLKDEVLGIVGAFSKDGEIVIAKEIIRPDVPVNNAMLPNDSESILAFVSDIHVGSNTFLPEKWNRFMGWLKKDPVAKDIKYMIMPGDLVDGIGIYPGQEDELLIEDVYAQYAELVNLIRGIPDWIKIIMMPGNHDAVRLAEPQPALPKEITSLFDSNILFVGNPCSLEIDGRSILAYHGRSIDDFIGSIRNLTYANPVDAMREMLKRRHLAPIYGDRTALAPEQKDYLVIDRVPNVFVTGHVHACKVAEYRGIKLINASAWQSQTAYQRMHNQNPDPAKVPMMSLGTGEVWVEDFTG